METGGRVWEMDIDWPAAGRFRAYDLAQPLAHGIPHHPNHPPYVFSLTKLHGDVVYPEQVSTAQELITTGGHVGTHIDALGHVSREGRVHGDVEIGDRQSYQGGVGSGSIERMTPVFAPGFLVDGPALLGHDLGPGEGIGADDLARWFGERRSPGPGAVVLVRTGWMRHWLDNRAYIGTEGSLPGVTIGAARWLAERGIAATGGDTLAYEVTPNPTLAVHVYLLVERGIPIMEVVNLEELAADGIHEFFFVAVPLPIRGGTGSPIRPLALVGI